MIVNYGPASRIADNEILLRLKEIENDALKQDTSISEISQTVNDITTRVEHTEEVYGNTETKYSELKQTVDGFTFVDETDGITKIKGSCIETGSINLTDSITFSQIGGTVSYNQLDDDTLATIEGAADSAYEANKNASLARTSAIEALSIAETAEEKAAANEDLLDSFMISGTTYIDGSRIYTGTLYSDAIHLGGELTVYTTTTGTTSCGYLGGNPSLNDGTAGVHFLSKNKQNECAVTNNGVSMRYGGTTNQASLTSNEFSINIGSSAYSFQASQFYTPLIVSNSSGLYPREDGTSSGGYYLGLNANRWRNVYSYDMNAENNIQSKNGICTTSDERLKNSIEDLPEKYIDLFDSITPRRYKMNEGTSGRYHVGFVAQEVEEAMNVAGINSQEFGGFVIDRYENEEGNEQEKYMLRYDEFIGILFAKIKQLESRIEELEAR